MHSWSIFGAWTSHGQTQIHKTHHGSNFEEATTFPLIIFSVPGHGAYTQMSFRLETPRLGVPKFPKLGLPQLWTPITLLEDVRLMWGLKQSWSPRWEISNGMWQATCTQVNQGDSWLLVVRNQIGNLTTDLFFSHNLCFKYSNESCEPILDIYVSRTFQWYKEIFNPMSFSPFNYPLKIWKSIEILTPKVGAHLGVWGFIPSHFPTLMGTWNVTLVFHSWPTPLQTLALVVNPKLGLRHPTCVNYEVIKYVFINYG
jgi:hypothetical protein